MALQRVTYELVIDIESGRELFRDWEWVETLIESCKKGREAQQQVTQQELANAKTDEQQKAQQTGALNTDISNIESTQPGQLSSYGSAQLASDMSNIQNQYDKAKQVGLAGIAQRGMGSAPSGAVSSTMNSANMAQAQADNNAYENALKEQYGENLAAMQARLGVMGQYNPNQTYGVASSSAADQTQQGSTLGDIGAGITGLAGAAGSVMGGLGSKGIGVFT